MDNFWGNPVQPIPTPFIGLTPHDDTTGSNHAGNQHSNRVMPIPGGSTPRMHYPHQPQNSPPVLSAAPPTFVFPGQPSVHPALYGPSMGHHQQLAGYYSGPAIPAMVAGPFGNRLLPNDTIPPQMPTPSNTHMSTGAMDMPSPNIQVHAGFVGPQSPLATTSDQIPLFLQPPSGHATNVPMGQTYPPAALNRMQEPPLDSRHNHRLDPEVHQNYQGLCLHAVMKDPRNQQTTAPLKIRREKKVVVELALHSDTRPFSRSGWQAIEIPQTRLVRPTPHTFAGKHLKLSTQVLACSTGVPNVQPCSNCWERERRTIDPNLNLQQYMVNFKAESRIIAFSRPSDKCLKVEVTFYFTCYSRHHGGLYELILKLHDETGNLVAQCPLPYKFIVTANGNDNGNYNGDYEPQDHTEPQQQNLFHRILVPNPPSVPVLERRTPELPTNARPVSANHHSDNPNSPAPVLHRVSPAEGPMSGGQTILLSGTNFPQHPQQMVYARFGSVPVTTIWINPYTLECELPPSPTPGTVRVTLSLYREPGAPEFGQSHGSFKYTPDHNCFCVFLRTISGQEHHFAPGTLDALVPWFFQNVSPVGRAHLYQYFNAPPINQSYSIGAGEMEGLILQFLTSFANSPSWEKNISLVNEHRQTLAHLAVLFRYTTLLDKVAEWGINVDVQDMNGFTALHCAYLCGDLDSAGILKGYGADEDIRDNLGRRPVDMYIPRTNDQGNGSPSSDRTSSSVQVSGTGDEWDLASVTSSQSGVFVDHNPGNPPAPTSRYQQSHTRQPTTSTRITSAPITMPSPMSCATDNERWIDGFSGLGLSDSPKRDDCSPPSRGSEATSSQERVHNAARSSPPLIQIPVPSPSQPCIPAYGQSSVLSQTAHSSASTSCLHINPCTKAVLDSRPVTPPTSAGSHITKRFDPPPHPPPTPSGSNVTPADSLISSDAEPPRYQEGSQTPSRDQKWPLSDEINDPEESKGDPVGSGKDKGKQPFHLLIEWEKLAEDLPADVKRQLLELAVQDDKKRPLSDEESKRDVVRLGKEKGKHRFHAPIGWEKVTENLPADMQKRLFELAVQVGRLHDLRPGNA